MVTPRKPAAGKKLASASVPSKSFAAPRKSKVAVVSSRLAYQGPLFNVYTDVIREPGGIDTVRDVIRHNGSVVILAVDDSKSRKNPLILLERQYRHAAGQYLIELPAGKLEPGESRLAGAKRELIEETGYRARQWTKLVRYFASPGFLGEWMQVFLARGITAGTAQPEADEFIVSTWVPLNEVLAMMYAGKILDGKTLVAVQMYAALSRAGKL